MDVWTEFFNNTDTFVAKSHVGLSIVDCRALEWSILQTKMPTICAAETTSSHTKVDLVTLELFLQLGLFDLAGVVSPEYCKGRHCIGCV